MLQFSSLRNKVAIYFNFDEFKTTFGKEIVGGIVTAISMLYIFSVEPNILKNAPSINSGEPNMAVGGIFIATAITAFLGSFIIGLVSKLPLAMAPGLGINAIFTFNIAQGSGQIGYQGALIAVMISSIIFVIVSATKLRTIILSSITYNLKKIITIGIGFFIAYIGLSDIGFVQIQNGLPVAQISQLKETYPSVLLGFFVLALVLIFHFKKITGGVIIAVLAGLIISLIIGNVSNDPDLQNQFSHWNGWSYAQFSGFKSNLSSTYQAFANSKIWTSPIFYLGVCITFIVSFFDASGTLYGIGNQINTLTDKDIKIKGSAFIGDSLGGLANGFVGTSFNTAFIESSTGVAYGARTGFSSICASLVLASSIILFPIFQLIKVNITGGILIYVGFLMMHQIRSIDWEEPEHLLACFLIILICVVTYSITNGIAVAFLGFSLACLINKKTDKISWLTLMLDIIFISYFIGLAFLQGT